jgi:hypothetical protein
MKDRKKALTDMMSTDEKSGLYMDEQSPVEWLFYMLWDEPKDKFTWHSLLKKAKEKEDKLKDMEGMEKQTAVNWLEHHYKKQMEIHGEIHSILLDDLFETAKQIEKGQIMKTWYDCKLSIIERNPTDAEQYYNETFKSE